VTFAQGTNVRYQRHVMKTLNLIPFFQIINPQVSWPLCCSVSLCCICFRHSSPCVFFPLSSLSSIVHLFVSSSFSPVFTPLLIPSTCFHRSSPLSLFEVSGPCTLHPVYSFLHSLSMFIRYSVLFFIGRTDVTFSALLN